MRTFNNDDFFQAGNFMVGIGHHDIREVALISKTTGEFVKMDKQNLKRSKMLRTVKRKFSMWLNSKETFTFSHLTPERINELVAVLKGKKFVPETVNL